MHHKATGCYRLFSPVESPNSADEKDLRPRFKERAEGQPGQEGAEAEDIEEARMAVEMSDDDTDATP